MLGEKILQGNKTHFGKLVEDERNLSHSISEYLIVLYHSERTNTDLELFRELILKHLNRSTIKSDLREVSVCLNPRASIKTECIDNCCKISSVKSSMLRFRTNFSKLPASTVLGCSASTGASCFRSSRRAVSF